MIDRETDERGTARGRERDTAREAAAVSRAGPFHPLPAGEDASSCS